METEHDRTTTSWRSGRWVPAPSSRPWRDFEGVGFVPEHLADPVPAQVRSGRRMHGRRLVRGGGSAPADLLRPGEDDRRRRHLRRALAGPQQRHPLGLLRADLQLSRAPGPGRPQRLPGAQSRRGAPARRAQPGVPRAHPLPGRDGAGQLARAPGAGRDGGHPGTREDRHPLLRRRRRDPAGHHGDRARRSRAAG